ncbi:MAG: hypothetical protein J6A74_02105 [Oscillospiraceae bacterium]|nr:hypothetical protein [Oscillospiraceae bacterium]
MKKLFTILLALSMLALCACTPAGEDAKPQVFSAGYARADITPENGTILGGYGDKDRFSEGALDYLYTTCVAVSDGSGDPVLLMTSDMVRGDWADELRKAVSEATGVPIDNVIHATTHTHSGAEPQLEGGYKQPLTEAMKKAATEAIADLAPAQIEIGSTQVENLSFVRHYTTDTGIVIGDNFRPDGAGSITGHTTQADSLLQVIRFNRGEKKPVVMINWQGHPTLASTTMANGKETRSLASADYIGFCRSYVEDEQDCLFAFYLSGSGNLNAYSRIDGEGVKHPKVYGEKLGSAVVSVLSDMKAVETGTVSSTRKVHKGTSATGGALDLPFYAVQVGDISFVTSQYEMFDTNARNIKDQTPFEMTFVLTLTNGKNGYMPTQECWDYEGCYEVGMCNYARGTAELMEKEYLQALQELHNGK